MAKIYVDDEEKEISLPLTIAQFIQQNKVVQPDMVTVQLNEEYVDKSDYDKTALNDGDHLDFLYFMGGGSL